MVPGLGQDALRLGRLRQRRRGETLSACANQSNQGFLGSTAERERVQKSPSVN